tara:strand:- start:2621 stop:3460 length:840 start_codon:yes stop_codon:yes gene_type:complete
VVTRNSVAVVNAKGGTFKTSIVGNLAVLAQEERKKVLVIDLDVQAQQSMQLGYMGDEVEPDNGADFANWIINGGPVPIRQNIGGRDGLDLLEGGPLLATEKLLPHRDSWSTLILDERLQTIKKKYDVIFIDFSPSITSLLTHMGLETANIILVPIDGSEMSIDGIDLLELMLEEETTKGEIKLDGYILTNVPISVFDRERKLMSQRIKSLGLDHVGSVYRVRESAFSSAKLGKSIGECIPIPKKSKLDFNDEWRTRKCAIGYERMWENIKTILANKRKG